MANRYWVGGTATWDATAGSKWALTSGGAGGQAVPTSADTVFFDANSGANTVTIGSGTAICSTLTMTGFTGTLAFGTNSITISGTNTTIFTGATTYSVTGTPLIICNGAGTSGQTRTLTTSTVTEANAISFNITTGSDNLTVFDTIKNLDCTGFSGLLTNPTRTIYGNLILSTGMSLGAGLAVNTFGATSGTQTITSNNKTLDFPVTINAPGATVRLVDALTMGSTRTLTLTNGTFDAFNQNVTVGLFASSNANTRTLTMGSGTWTLSGIGTVWFTTNTTGLTFNVNTANIVLSNTSTSARGWNGGPLTYNKLTIGGTTGTSTLSINSTSTFSEITSTKTVAHTISFGASITVGNWTVTGTAGNVVTVQSLTAGTQRTITYSGSSTISMDYMSITDINFSYTLGAANPYLVYAGANSTNNGNNAGILFQPTTVKAYRLTTGTSWTTPADWNNASNTIHMIGAGGGGATSAVSGNNRAAGGGGGGGGYRVLTNQTLSGSIPYTIGTSTGNANGGDTTFNTTNIAGGGSRGTATTVPASSGGAGGTGTFAGGTGGAGAFGTAASTGYGSGGGGGAGGPNGVGGTGGAGFGSTTAANIAGGGGGGNGGGSNGTNGSSALGGNGGNNSSGIGGAIGTSGSGTAGTVGGGGAGGSNTTAGGNGGSGIDISNTIGGSGGKGGASSVLAGTANTGLYGGGGTGGTLSTVGGTFAGGAGSQGVIFIVYTPGGAPVSNSNFFLMFG
jgi:hypothetical protein